MPCKNARVCCTGTAWIANCAPAIASAADVVAVTFAGSTKSCKENECVVFLLRVLCLAPVFQVFAASLGCTMHAMDNCVSRAQSSCARNFVNLAYFEIARVTMQLVDVAAEVWVAQQQSHLLAMGLQEAHNCSVLEFKA